jgi:predicted DNA-binding WGR domain protein
MAKRYFEYKDAKSKKFWEVSVSGKKVNIRYGKLGTDGQTSLKELGTPAEAKAHAEKQAAGKVKKGYKEAKAKAVKKTAKKAVKKKAMKKIAKKAPAKGGEIMNAQYLRVCFGIVDEEIDWNDVRGCIDHKQTSFIIADYDNWGKCAYIQVGDDIKKLGVRELEKDVDPIPDCLKFLAKYIVSSGRSDAKKEWLYGFMKSCLDGDEDGIESVKRSVSDNEEEVIEFFEGTGLYGEHDGMDFCLIESCSLKVEITGDKVSYNGKIFTIKDIYNLMNDWTGKSAPRPTPSVSTFRSKHDYSTKLCIWGCRPNEDEW